MQLLQCCRKHLPEGCLVGLRGVILRQLMEQYEGDALKEAIEENLDLLIPKHIIADDMFASINYLCCLAHGIGEPDDTGDAIVNGAVDNATAIASMIEIARVMAEGPAPGRSVLFIALAAEESGLLGATYYAANPLRPLATTAAVVNMEMWSPDGPTHDISSWGLGKVSL